MHLSLIGPDRRIFLFTDYMTFFLCLYFAGIYFAMTGTRRIHIFSLSADRGILVGLFFVVLAACVPVVVRLLNARKSLITQWFRLFYVQLYFGFFFSQSIILSNIIYRGWSLDHVFAAADAAIFGGQPSLRFCELLPGPPILVELFFFAYFFFYLLISIGVWILFFRGRRRDALAFISYLLFGFYLLYAFYVFFPVKGPKYYFPELRHLWYENFEGYIFTWFFKRIFNRMTLSGAAFPSSHAAISVLALMLNFKFQKTWGFIFLPFTVLLLFSTVYIYAHYAIDILAGIALGVLYYFLLPAIRSAIDKLYLKAERKIFTY